MRRSRLALVLGLAVLPTAAWAPTARASHESVCNVFPASGTKLETYGCNPRQNCLNAAGNNQAARAVCNNTMPTSGTCTRTVNTTPRADCVAALPTLKFPRVTAVEDGKGGGNKVFPGAPDLLAVRGDNVGVLGTTVVVGGTPGDFVVIPAPVPGCGGESCLGISVTVSPGAALGPRTFQIRPPHGHQPWAEARIEVVSAPAAQQPQQPQVSMPKLDIAPPKLRRFEPDVAIVDVKGTGPGSGGVAVTVKNVGNAPTNARCAVFAATYQYNPRNSSPNKWDPQAGCFQQQYEFGVLLPGQSETISACGYPPDKVSPGFWQVYNVGYHCGGESNDSNNKFSIRKEPDAAYFKSFEGQR